MTNTKINTILNLKEISYELKSIRKSKGMTISDIVDKTGLSYSTIYKIENYDSSYNMTSLCLYVNALGFNIELKLIDNPVKDI